MDCEGPEIIRVSPLTLLTIAILPVIALAIESGASDNTRNVVQIGEILKKIEAGEPIEYDNIIVEGEFNLSNANLPTSQIRQDHFEEGLSYYLNEKAKIVRSPLRIEDSEIKGFVNLDNIIFENLVDFKNTRFRGGAFFRGTKFGGTANFGECEFSQNTYFDSAQFKDDLNFRNAKFDKNVEFLKAQFNGTVYFNNAQFYGFTDFRNAKFRGLSHFDGGSFGENAYFQDAQFLGESSFRTTNFMGLAGFWGTDFEGIPDFRGAKFNGDAYFLKGLFNSEAYFNEVEFDNYADFRGAKFSSDADFSNTQFGGEADFWNTRYSRRVDFSNAKFVRSANFGNSQFSDNRNYASSFLDASFDGNANFADSQFSSIFDFRYAHFNKSLNLTGTRFDRLEISWNDIKDKLISDEPTYVELVRNFENMGQYEDADNCFYQYRKHKQESSGLGWSKFIDSTAWVTCGYGVRPEFIIYWSIFLIIIFGCLFYWVEAITQGTDHRRYKFVLLPDHSKKVRNSTIWDALYYSTSVFFGIHSVAGHWRTIGRWKYVSMLEDIVGWVFIMVLVITLGHIMIR